MQVRSLIDKPDWSDNTPTRFDVLLQVAFPADVTDAFLRHHLVANREPKAEINSTSRLSSVLLRCFLGISLRLWRRQRGTAALRSVHSSILVQA